MKRFILLLLIVSVLGIAAPAAAQDTASSQSGCDIATLNQLMDTFLTSLQAVKDKKSTDPMQISDYLQKLANVANQTRAFCDGLAFSGKKQLVIGPVTIPEGVYRVTGTTAKSMIVKIQTITGECGAGTKNLDELLLFLSKGEAANGAEAILTSKGCTTFISISDVQADWKLSFERVTTD